MSRPTLSETSPSVRFQLKITQAEIDAINEWRHANRVPTLSEAVRRLIASGLGQGASS